MLCFYCEQPLSVQQYRQLNILTLCCNPRQCFCIKCLLDPDLIEENIFRRSPFPCLTCKREYPPEAVREKRKFVNVQREGVRRALTPTRVGGVGSQGSHNPAVYFSGRQPQNSYEAAYRSMRAPPPAPPDLHLSPYSQSYRRGSLRQTISQPYSQPDDFFLIKPKQNLINTQTTMNSLTQSREPVYRYDEGPTQEIMASSLPYVPMRNRQNSDKMEEDIDMVASSLENLSLSQNQNSPAQQIVPSQNYQQPSLSYEQYCRANNLYSYPYSPPKNYTAPQPQPQYPLAPSAIPKPIPPRQYPSPPKITSSHMTSSVTFFETPAIKRREQEEFFVRQKREEVEAVVEPQSPRFGARETRMRVVETEERRGSPYKMPDYFDRQAQIQQTSLRAVQNANTFFRNYPKTNLNELLLQTTTQPQL